MKYSDLAVAVLCSLYQLDLANAVIQNEDDLITECSIGGHHQTYIAESSACFRMYASPTFNFTDSELQCAADAPAGTKGRLAHLPSNDAAGQILGLGATPPGFLGAKRINPSTTNIADWSWVEGGQVGDPVTLTSSFNPSSDDQYNCMAVYFIGWPTPPMIVSYECGFTTVRWCEFSLDNSPADATTADDTTIADDTTMPMATATVPSSGNQEPAIAARYFTLIRSGARLSTSIIQSLGGVSLTQCSMECFEQGTVCGGFNYGSDKSCELTSTKIQDVPANEIISNAAFNRYE